MLEEKLKTLPENPGVYLMKNSQEKIIYIGKAKFFEKSCVTYLWGKQKFL